MTDMKNLVVCSFQEYCTDCPVRKGCTRRMLYYKEEYLEILKIANISTIRFLCTYQKMDFLTAISMIDKFCKDDDKKRQRELELHPTYSPE